MTTDAKISAETRQQIMESPEHFLSDPEIMHALADANERTRGSNVIDLRAIAMTNLEKRMDRLERTHKTVIAAAYENVAGTHQIHRAVLQLLERKDLSGLLDGIREDLPKTMRIDTTRLILETTANARFPLASVSHSTLNTVDPGHVSWYLNGLDQTTIRKVTLRSVPKSRAAIYEANHDQIKSEACLFLEFGEGHLPGLLLLGSRDPDLFSPDQGTDLLDFFANVCERALVHHIERL